MNPCEAYNKQLVFTHTTLFVHSVVSDSLQPHGLRHTGFPVLTISWSCPNSRPLNQWCHPTILSSVAPLSSHPQSFPASGSFPHHSGFKQTLESVSDTSAQHSLIHLVSATLTPQSSTLAATCPLCSYAPSSTSCLGFPLYFPMKWGQKYRA